MADVIPTIEVSAAQRFSESFLSASSFSQKILNFTIRVAQNPGTAQPTSIAGPAVPGSTINLSGFRARVNIGLYGSIAGSSADISIYGLSQQLMNQLTTMGVVGDQVPRNSIIVSAGSNPVPAASAAIANLSPPSGFPVVFAGTIWFAFGDYNRMPDVPLRIIGQGGLSDAVQSAQPLSYTGKTSVVEIMRSLAAKVFNPQTGAQGVAFEQNDVDNITLSSPYLPGTVMQQIQQAADHAAINAQIVDGGTKLAIWKSGRIQGSIPLISPGTGMIGYPVVQQSGWLLVKSLYNPNVILGGQINVLSSIPQASRLWTVYSIGLHLDSLLPHGDWAMSMMCQSVAGPAGVPPPLTR